jgi:hypothetical protein
VATQDDVRRIALSLPEVVEDATSYAVANKGKPRRIAWVWRERVHPKKARVLNPRNGVQVADLEEKEMSSRRTTARRSSPSCTTTATLAAVRFEAIEVDELTEPSPTPGAAGRRQRSSRPSTRALRSDCRTTGAFVVRRLEDRCPLFEVGSRHGRGAPLA